MLQNYLITAYRNILKSRSFSSINILGLALGMAATILIIQYVLFEISFDSFHSNKSRIYRIRSDFYQQNELILQSAQAFPGVGPALMRNYPEVAAYTRLVKEEGTIRYKESEQNPVNFNGRHMYYADGAFFNIFDVEWLKGGGQHALQEPASVVISESMARQHLGKKDILGKVLYLNSPAGEKAYTIRGIFKDFPANSHLPVNFLFSNEVFVSNFKEPWSGLIALTYILLHSRADAETLAARLPQFTATHLSPVLGKAGIKPELLLQSLLDIHLHSQLADEASPNGSATHVYFLGVVAFFILVIAWANFINLSTARAIDRAKEVGVRKSVGATRMNLVSQFFTEALLINVFAAVLAYVLAYVATPFYKELTGLALPANVLTSSSMGYIVAVIFLAGTFLSSIYPAYILSSFKPIKVLKGHMGQAGGKSFRKSLVVFQFMASFILITGTFCVYRQLSFMQHTDPGLAIEQTMVVKGALADKYLSGEKSQAFEESISNYTSIEGVASSTTVPGQTLLHRGNNVHRPGQINKAAGVYYFNWIDYNFLDLYQARFLAGRNFSKAFPGDKSQGIIINAEATKQLGFSKPEDALQATIQVKALDEPVRTLTVIGILQNYHQESLKEIQKPILFMMQAPIHLPKFYSLKVHSQNIEAALPAIQRQYARLYPGNPFEYFFLDEYFDEHYKSEKRFGKVFALFTLFAIVVASLGLLGLVSYSTSQRTKEIGIRKVLGASVFHIVGILLKEYMWLVLAAFALACPLAYYLMALWLSGYAFRITIHPWLFILPAVFIVMIALLTVGAKTIKAALANPVKSLRSE